MILLSLLIICLGFVFASDRERKMACSLLAFLLGVFLYLTESIWEWNRKRISTGMAQAALAIMAMLAAGLLLLRGLGERI